MTTIKHVLAATDLSVAAQIAIERAFRIADEHDARLTVMHVLNEGALEALQRLFGRQGAELEPRIRAEAEAELARLVAEAGAGRSVEAELHSSAGNVLQAILAHGDALDASLLVVGAHGESALRSAILGTTSERLLRKTMRPMLVVREPASETYRRALVPVDFSAWTQESIRIARALAPNATILLFNAFLVPFEHKLRFAGVDAKAMARHIETARSDALRSLRKTAEAADLSGAEVELFAWHGNPMPGILAQVDASSADLIVVGKHGRGMFEELLLGSITKHVLAEAPCDVVVAPLGHELG